MSTAQIKTGSKSGFKDVLNGISSLETPELEQFFQQVAQLLASRKSPALSKQESELYLKINTGYPPELNQQYEQLSAKKHQGIITPEEQTYLIALTEKFEALDSERLEHLLELAQLRRISLEKLLENLSQPKPAHG